MILTVLCLLMLMSFFFFGTSFVLVMTIEKEIYEKLFTISALTLMFFVFIFMISLVITYGI